MLDRSARPFALVLLLFFPLSVAWWHHADTRPASFDESRHMQLAVDYRSFLTQGVPLTNEWSHVYPPLYHLAIIPALSVGIPSESHVALSYLVPFALLLMACVMLTRQAGRPDWQGVAAALLCLSFPSVLITSRRALIDFPLMCWTTGVIALLGRTDGFRRGGASALWGVAAGLGLLIKAPFAFFMVGPVLWTATRGSFKKRYAVLALVLAVLISAPWYGWESVYFLSKGSRLAGENTAAGTDPHTLSGWLFYIRLLVFQIGTPGLIVVGIGALWALGRGVARSGLLVSWILSGYLILSLLMNKDPRHSMPLLPALALLAVWGWADLLPRAARAWGLGLAGVGLLIATIATVDRPVREDWQHTAIVNLLAREHDPSEPFLATSVLSHQEYFFSRTLKWSAFRMGVPLKPVSPGDGHAGFAEFIVVRNGNQGTEARVMERQWQSLTPNQRSFSALYAERGRFHLPDDSEAIVYGRQRPRFRVEGLTREAVAARIAQSLHHWVQGPLTVLVDATPEGLPQGRLEQVLINCKSCSIQGVPIDALTVLVDKPWLNLYRLWDDHTLGLLAFKTLTPTLTLRAEPLQAWLSERHLLENPTVEMADGHLRVAGHAAGIPVAAQAHVEFIPGLYPRLAAVLDAITVAGVHLPGWLIGKAHRQELILYPIPDFPGQIAIGAVILKNGTLTVKTS